MSCPTLTCAWSRQDDWVHVEVVCAPANVDDAGLLRTEQGARTPTVHAVQPLHIVQLLKLLCGHCTAVLCHLCRMWLQESTPRAR